MILYERLPKRKFYARNDAKSKRFVLNKEKWNVKRNAIVNIFVKGNGISDITASPVDGDHEVAIVVVIS